ncbi:hypothetical protein SAMN05428950_101892 [Sphingomonas sp. OV641]|uniref:hypothetical protein n=1 Tax=Sphingomonas sp. OV641 TaxID=1881068 RepID=UPI0008B3E2FF|nr:hypothetical protein [Sphingomonas sp. OV641]SEJ02750.1 hypothetical protein SAMN05428950_101892 [Sphingomonas sp. OV641]
MIVRDPRAKLRELAVQRRTSLNGLSCTIGRPRRYLTRFVKEGHPERLSATDIDQLSRFFGVSPVEFGADDPRWRRWRDHAFHTTERKLGFEVWDEKQGRYRCA